MTTLPVQGHHPGRHDAPEQAFTTRHTWTAASQPGLQPDTTASLPDTSGLRAEYARPHRAGATLARERAPDPTLVVLDGPPPCPACALPGAPRPDFTSAVPQAAAAGRIRMRMRATAQGWGAHERVAAAQEEGAGDHVADDVCSRQALLGLSGKDWALGRPGSKQPLTSHRSAPVASSQGLREGCAPGSRESLM